MEDIVRPLRLLVQTRMSRFADDYRVTDYSIWHDDSTVVPCEFRSSSGAGYPIELILAEVLLAVFHVYGCMDLFRVVERICTPFSSEWVVGVFRGDRGSTAVECSRDGFGIREAIGK